jgi:hypothetical protein
MDVFSGLTKSLLQRIMRAVRLVEASPPAPLATPTPAGILPPPPWQYGVLDAALAAGGTAAASVWRKNPQTGVWEDSSENQTVAAGPPAFAPYPLPAGSPVRLDYHYQAQAWHPLLLDQRWLRFRPNADVAAREVMVPAGVELVGGQLVVKTKQATAFANKVLLVNGAAAVASGAIGLCLVGHDQPMLAAYDTGGSTPAAGDLVGVYPSSWKLRPQFPGFVALDAGSSGLVWVLRKPDIPPYWGTLDYALDAGGSTTVSILFTDEDQEADSGQNVTGFDKLLCTGDSLAAGSKVLVNFHPQAGPAGTWYVEEADCGCEAVS